MSAISSALPPSSFNTAVGKTKSSRRFYTMPSKTMAAFRDSMKSVKNLVTASRASSMAARIPTKSPAKSGIGAKESAPTSKKSRTSQKMSGSFPLPTGQRPRNPLRLSRRRRCRFQPLQRPQAGHALVLPDSGHRTQKGRLKPAHRRTRPCCDGTRTSRKVGVCHSDSKR
jgi:hypothetical protein